MVSDVLVSWRAGAKAPRPPLLFRCTSLPRRSGWGGPPIRGTLGAMPPAFTYPLWTPHTFTDGSLRWVLWPWYPGILLAHAKSSGESTGRAGIPCPEPVRRQDAPLRQGRRLRGVPAGHDRGA